MTGAGSRARLRAAEHARHERPCQHAFKKQAKSRTTAAGPRVAQKLSRFKKENIKNTPCCRFCAYSRRRAHTAA